MLLATWGLSCSLQSGCCVLRSTLSGPLPAGPAACTAVQAGSLLPHAGIQPQVGQTQTHQHHAGQSPCAQGADRTWTRRPGSPFTLLSFPFRRPRPPCSVLGLGPSRAPGLPLTRLQPCVRTGCCTAAPGCKCPRTPGSESSTRQCQGRGGGHCVAVPGTGKRALRVPQATAPRSTS